MNKSTTSVLMAAMMVFSGFAAAQTNDVKAGTQGGAGPTGASGYGDNKASVTDRASVKAQIVPQKAGTQGGAGPTGASGLGDNKASVTDRAAVKAEIMPQKAGIQGGSGASPAANPNTAKMGAAGSGAMAPKMTAAEKKAQRTEARAARKARLAGKANNPARKSGTSAN